MGRIIIKKINTDELVTYINNPKFKIIDIRPIDAYNGWKLRNEKRGGHIIGAKSLPYKWSKYIDWKEIVKLKNITKDNSLVIYGYDKEKIDEIANLFIKTGFKDLKIYYNFITEWVTNTKYPIERLKRYQQLVGAEWLKQLIDTGHAPEYYNNNFVICHAHYQNRKDYEEGHIQGAISLDTNLLENSETWNRRTSKELKQTFKSLGIKNDITVILYGCFSNPDNKSPFPGSSAGHLGAMRCAFIMMYAGVKDVRILNGGLQAWMDSGFKTTTEEYKPVPVNEFGANIPSNPHFVVDLKEAKEILKNHNKNLVSIRSYKEYIGEVSGYNYIEKKGRIPGSIFGNCGSDAYHMENYRNLDHTTREYHEIEKMWKEVGITSDKHNSFYCGTGWRGSEAFFNAWLMGWNDISLFDGGWFEWIKNNLPYDIGVPREKQKNNQYGGRVFLIHQ